MAMIPAECLMGGRVDQIQFGSRFRSRLLIALQKAIIDNFQEHDWKELDYATGHKDFIRSHKRLLRSLNWQDEEYGGSVFDFLEYLLNRDVAALYKMVEHHKLRPYQENHSLDVFRVGIKRGPCARSAPAADFSQRGCSACFV